ncbi:hypothetical protein M413DRAFT_445850 [Hebeloma cylindrosporum]|uniref:Aminoglycoside phosphotransferase domain-containing protein n=1 Tax=Hebeloma cylindrosporum TaxID=76867 RepID=A0A0C2YJE3_HEBCY|nr:hypothetical protein M413DRAFT_445850 [Hebeloma cylindrosporum h7]
MVSISPSDRQAIIELCDRHEKAHRLERDHRRCVVFGSYFVKYDAHVDLYCQYKTQEYLFNHSIGDPSAPRIPAVITYFAPEERWGYLVSELIDPIAPADDAPEAIADALRWLHRVPVPTGLIFGPLGGGLARHRVFKNCEAPLRFSSIQALQTYMNRALDRVPRPHIPPNRPPDMDFLDDALIFTQSDMHISNFALDKDNKICMFDFEAIGIVPESFARFTVTSRVWSFLGRVAECMGWTPDRNRESMARAGGVLLMVADPTLGLDVHGNPKPKKRRSRSSEIPFTASVTEN